MLKGRTALVTEADKTIGRAIAHALAAEGCSLVCHGGGQEGAAKVAAELGAAHGVPTRAVAFDLASLAAIEEGMAADKDGIDILVHTSCPQHLARMEDFPDSVFERILTVGLVSHFRLAKLVLPGMRKRAYGRILAMSSVQGLVASTDKSAYVAAKHGLVGFTKAVALENAGSGVTANAFCPGWTGTEGTRAQAAEIGKPLRLSVDEALKRMLDEKQPSKQFVPVDALGALVVFLCSKAGDQITGVALPVDGGWVAQ